MPQASLSDQGISIPNNIPLDVSSSSSSLGSSNGGLGSAQSHSRDYEPFSGNSIDYERLERVGKGSFGEVFKMYVVVLNTKQY